MKVKSFIPTKPEEMERLKAFAQSFEHRINPRLPTMIFTDEKGEWIGYTQFIHTPIMLVGMHPEKCKGRITVKMIEKMQNWSEMQHGEMLVLLHKSSKFYLRMGQLGFQEAGMTLFKSEGRP